MAEQAVALDKAKKSEILTYLGCLFAALTDDQRQRVEARCPAVMRTVAVSAGEGGDTLDDDDDDDVIDGEVELVVSLG